MSLEVKPEADSGFLIVGAPVMVAEDDTAAAAGKVGFTGPMVDEAVLETTGPALSQILQSKAQFQNYTCFLSNLPLTFLNFHCILQYYIQKNATLKTMTIK